MPDVKLHGTATVPVFYDCFHPTGCYEYTGLDSTYAWAEAYDMLKTCNSIVATSCGAAGTREGTATIGWALKPAVDAPRSRRIVSHGDRLADRLLFGLGARSRTSATAVCSLSGVAEPRWRYASTSVGLGVRAVWPRLVALACGQARIGDVSEECACSGPAPRLSLEGLCERRADATGCDKSLSAAIDDAQHVLGLGDLHVTVAPKTGVDETSRGDHGGEPAHHPRSLI